MSDTAAFVDPATAQRTASDPGVSAWVGASAGTGKTRVLTDRVLRLMLAGAPPGRILCLTFTKAAAAEMANRLSERLARWAVLGDEELAADLFELTGQKAQTDVMTAARALFARVLDVPGGLKIQTIHAFCQSLLGRFPLEAGLPPHFQVMDERTSSEMLTAARDRVLAEARHTPILREALGVVTERAGEQVFGEIIAALAAERRRFSALFAAHGGLAGVIDATRERLGLGRDDTGPGLIAAACADAVFAKTDLAKVAQALAAGSPTDRKNAAVMADWLAVSDGRQANFEDYAAVYLTKEGTARARLVTMAVAEAMPEVVDIMAEEAARLLAVRERLAAVAVAEGTAALLGLAGALLTAYDDLKRRHARLDYDDLILLTRDLLSRAEAAEWVLFKLDGGLDHILIDEAQDTNPDQWAVVKALAEEFFAGEGARDLGRTVFAVGAAKQSIYGFQRADPAAFAATRDLFAARVKETDQRWRPVELAVSFRSTNAVLQLVDRVFAAEDARAGLMFDDGEVRHLFFRRGQGGLVELWPLVRPADDDDGDWSLPVIQQAELSPSARLAAEIAGRVRGWLAAGECLESRGRALRPGDIMILVQRRADFVAEVVAALKSHGVPVAGTDRMVLADQLAVLDLLSAVRFALLPEDELALAEVLKGPLCNLDDDNLFELAHGRTATLGRTLQSRAAERDDWGRAADLLADLLRRADFAPPYEFFAHLLGPAGGRRRLMARLGPEVNDPIDEFLALALQFEQSHTPSLQGFLRWVDAGEAEVKRDPELGRDEVRVMTVHGAKGLQAPVVILPDTVRVPGQDDRLMWLDPAEAEQPPLMLWPGTAASAEPVSREARGQARRRRDQEYRRLLYVALTRAEDRLYIGGWETSRKRGDDCWYEMVRRVMDGWAAPTESGDGVTWRLETKQEGEPDRIRKSCGSAEESYPLPDWVRTPPPPEPAPPKPLAPSRGEGEEPPVRSPLSDDGEARFLRGRLIHRLLETLPELAPDKRAEAALRYLGNPAHGLDEEKRQEIADETLRVMEHPDFAAIFGPGSHAEVAIAGVMGDHVISGQVDRLLVGPDKILVIDYKTNRPPPARVEEVSALYLAQMAAYRAALSRIYPGRAVECALLWTDSGVLMPLPEHLLIEFAPDGAAN